MGIWDELQFSVSRLVNRKPSGPSKRPSDTITALHGQPATALVSRATKFVDAVRSNGAQKLDDYFPGPHRREKISRVLTNLGKFAVDSAIEKCLESVTGGIQVYQIVREGLKDQPKSRPSNEIKKQDLTVATEEMQAKMEKMQEDVNILKQQNQTCAECSRELEPLKELSDEPIQTPTSAQTDKKKVVIRSRL
ncbi:unnamed protein product [Coffea canephora]|uniref:Uncharacterized protein n=2 Tax=Coffea TaxID=13442 RepID=A0A068UBK7_COFCA|nr:unnamed protein product [Coffea canephora]